MAYVNVHVLRHLKEELNWAINGFGLLINQVRTSLWPVRVWFLKIDPVWIVGMCVCVSVPEAINN